MSEFVGFRLHRERDKDIIEDLERFKDRTARMKEVYRKALAMEQKVVITNISKEEQRTFVESWKKAEQAEEPVLTTLPAGATLDWSNFPKEPTITKPEGEKAKPQAKNDIKSNILAGF